MNWNSLIPLPLRIKAREGTFPLSSHTIILCEQDYIAENFALLCAADFNLTLKTRTGPEAQPEAHPARPEAQPAHKKAQLSRPETNPEAQREAHPLIVLQVHKGMEAEEYSLDISPWTLKIQAGGRAGFLHAYHTIKQYLLSLPPTTIIEGVFPLKCVEISDSPAVRWRGAMLDVSRHIFPVEFILHFIDLLALHHLNIFHWHLTDDQGWRIGIPGYPKLLEISAWRDDMTTDQGSYGGYYSEKEIGRVVEHAYRRGVTIVPEIDLPGHVASALAAYPHLSCRKEHTDVPVRHGIFEDVLCAGTPEVFPFIEAVVRQVCRLFPSDYIHLGGDECPTARWDECPSCRAVKQQQGFEQTSELQGYLMNHAARIAEEYDKRVIAWDEVLSVRPDFTPITAVWRDACYVKDAIAAGTPVILCPQHHGTYLDHKHRDDPDEPGRLGVSSVKDVYSLDIFHDLTVEERSSILGGQANLWTEELKYGRQVEYMAFPRLSALAENLWLPSNHKKWRRFSASLKTHIERLERLGAQPYRGPLE